MPERVNFKVLTVTAPEPAVKVHLPNGILAAPTTIDLEAGVVTDRPTLKPPAAGTGAGVPGIPGVPGTLATAEYFAREIAPKYPAAGETALAACHLATAAFVAGPKKVVSLPTEPAPLAATV